MKHVILYSGGAASYCAAKRVAAEHGVADLVLLFTDTSMEDETLYKFLEMSAVDVGAELVWLKDGQSWFDFDGHV